MSKVEKIKHQWDRDRMPINPWKDVKFLLSEIKRLREGIQEVLGYTLPYLAEKRLRELLEEME
jgi:hypothetical protein